MSFDIKNYLDTYFKHIKIESPLFYNAPVGIRFELGVPYRGVDDPKYFLTVQLRAKTIFEALFDEQDEVIVLVKRFTYVEPYSAYNVGDSLFSSKYIKGDLDARIQLYEESPVYDEDDGSLVGYSQTFYIQCLRSEVAYSSIIRAIGNQDFAIRPFITDSVFFINPVRHTIFFMYDDRGLDVIANNKNELQPLYTIFNNWILDYDRERIIGIFE